MQYFNAAISSGATSLVANVSLVTKVYFPRVLLPVSAVAVPVVDWPSAASCSRVDGVWVRSRLARLLLPRRSSGSPSSSRRPWCCWLSAINVRYRDVPHAIPSSSRPGCSPRSGLPFAIGQCPRSGEWILSLNPLTAVVSGWRWCILGSAERGWARSLPAVGVARGPRSRGACLLPSLRAALRGHDLTSERDRRRRALRSGTEIGELQASYGRCATRSSSSSRAASTGTATTTSTLWALDDVSFELRRGRGARSHRPERGGQVDAPEGAHADHCDRRRGRGGSRPRGQPARGGTGFHPELTGRENVYLNGAILGMRRREIDREVR